MKLGQRCGGACIDGDDKEKLAYIRLVLHVGKDGGKEERIFWRSTGE